ncbi:hypothetical protein DL98DRAFT_564643 [Cadophora sp. DSE1049]|nr:hypothetical protein DL98DRAFT_564643 [Cadophora sp. DSE1049]
MEFGENSSLESDSRWPRLGINADTSPHSACDSCKRRKIRCSGDIPCHHCQRNGVRCHYTSGRGKIAVVERHFAHAQKRVQLLEQAWHKFVPHIELAYALHVVEPSTAEIGENEPAVRRLIRDTPNLPADVYAGAGPSDTISLPSSPKEFELDNADALEWDETADVDSIADGIGSLTVDPKGSGYMGPQSGNALLRYLQSIAILFPALDGSSAWNEPISSHERILPPLQPRSHTFIQQCIDWYFQYYHPAYPILHEGFFRAEFMGAIPKPKDGSWVILLNVVIAIGAFAGPESSENADIYFSNMACDSLSVAVLQRGSLPLVQAFALLANYLQKRGKPNSGFTFLGIAYNMALGIGLHREFSQESLSAFTMEIRRRVWWTLYIFDSGARLTFGRPSIILDGVNIERASNLHDHDLSVDIEQLLPSRDEPTVTTSLIWQSKLAVISNLANGELLKKRLPEKSVIIPLDDRVISWRHSLPAYFHYDASEIKCPWFQIPRMILLWRSWHLRIVMTRPYLLDIVKNRRPLDVSDADDAAGRCINSAQECVASITGICIACDILPGALVWYATYWLITAVLAIVTCLVYDPHHVLGYLWRQQVEDAKLVLQRMAGIEPLAQRAALILEKVMDVVPQSPDSTIFTFNEPIRMGIVDTWSQSWVGLPSMDNDVRSVEQMEPVQSEMGWAMN